VRCGISVGIADHSQRVSDWIDPEKIVQLLVRMISGEREQLLDIDATDFNKWKCSIGFRFVLKEK
jgi:hypothetical protein